MFVIVEILMLSFNALYYMVVEAHRGVMLPSRLARGT